MPPVAEGVSEGSTANNSNNNNKNLPPLSLGCADNDVLNSPAPQKQNPGMSVLSLKVLPLVMPMRLWLRMVERRTIPPKRHLRKVKKSIFHQSSPSIANPPTKIMNHMKMGMILTESFFTLMILLRWERILTFF